MHPQYALLLPRPLTHRQAQSWELQQLHVVQWQFLEKQKVTASSLPGWHQSRLFFGLNPHFPLLPSRLSCLKELKGHLHELLHYYSLIHYFISRTLELK
jgi:hypothetical protein